MGQAPFTPGDEVRRTRNPSLVGQVQSSMYDDQLDEWMVRVRFGDRTQGVPADELERAEGGPPDAWDDLVRGLWGSARDFRSLLTWERLRKPPGPVGSSFGTARARLYPFQFKPLIKFLDNPNHAILIADEVGLGKTIEAGYILAEWQKRQSVDTALVVVPARLRSKWKQELAKRFDEQFEIVGARDFQRAMRKVRNSAQLEPFRWIASYESLRMPDVIDALREVSPPIDFLILDEAHRVRNKDTLQYKLADALRACAQAMVFLTATPVQTGLENLHTLLDLLEDGGFGSANDFLQLIQANTPILHASQFASVGRFDEAVAALARLDGSPLTRDLHRSSAVQDLIVDLRSTSTPSRAERVALQAAVNDLSLTGHVISRTRKVEVFEDRARRTPQTVKVRLNPEERAIYDVVEQVTRLVYGGAGWGQTMASLTAYRYTASCIPAGVGYMRARLRDHGLWLGRGALAGEVDEDFADEHDEVVQGSPAPGLHEHIGAALKGCPAPRQDSKLQEFLRAIGQIRTDDRAEGRKPRKIVVFSFFKRTLAYLSEQLDLHGLRHQLVHGGIPIDDREERIEAFLTDPELNVLLSSEVGGEGLDLQAASVVVNYDLPWNPMVVEQRIGRVDRIGQESDRIVIINLVCEDTIEDRILLRLYDRIDLFRASIGEMEEILGARDVHDLVVEHLSGRLSDDELAERVKATADAAIRRQRDARTLSDKVDDLLAADQAILDQIRGLVDGRRLPSSHDIAGLLLSFLESRFPGVRLEGDPTQEVARLDLPATARARFEQWAKEESRRGHRLIGTLHRSAVSVTVDGDVAMRHPKAEFLQARHPLVQFAVDSISREAARQGTAFAVRLGSRDLPPGAWVAGIWALTTRGVEDDTELVCVAADLVSAEQAPDEHAEAILRALLSRAEELDPRPPVDHEVLQQAVDQVNLGFHRLFRLRQRSAGDLLKRRQVRRQATWEATLLQQVGKAQDHLEAMHQKQARPFAIAMAQAKLDKRVKELQRVRELAEVVREIEVEADEVAVVIAVNHPVEGTDDE